MYIFTNLLCNKIRHTNNGSQINLKINIPIKFPTILRLNQINIYTSKKMPTCGCVYVCMYVRNTYIHTYI